MTHESQFNGATLMKVLIAGIFLANAILGFPTRGWAETTVTGDVDAGFQFKDVSSNESKFEEYGDVPQGFVVPHALIQSTSDHDQTTFEGKNMGQNNARYDLEYNRNYKLDVDGYFDQTPHDYSNIGKTLYTQTSNGNLTIPTQIQSTIQTANPTTQQFNSMMNSYISGGRDADLSIQDNKAGVNMGFKSGEHMRYNLGVSQDLIQGNKPGSYALGQSFPIQMPVPVDWKVYNLQAGSQYASKKAQFGLNYQMSSFDNEINTLKWSNPKRLTDSATAGAASGQTALAPDNWSQNISMNGGAELPLKTRVTAKGSMGYMRQNDALLPFTDNTALSAPKLSTNTVPENTANATMFTWMQDYALTNRIVKPLTLGARYHSYQLVNRTSEVTFPGRSSFDNSWTASPSSNDRFEYRKDTIEGTADLQIMRPWSAGLKYQTEYDHRTQRETRDVVENTLTADTDLRATSNSLLRGSYTHAHRMPQDLVGDTLFEETSEGVANTFEDLPGLRRFDTSERIRDAGKVLAQWTPGPFSFEFNGSLTHDRFQQGQGNLLEGTTNQAAVYGVLESQDASAGGTLGWDAMERLSFDVYYQYEQTKALQRNNKAGLTTANIQNPNYDFSTESVDRYQFAGISANIGKPVDRVGVKLAYDVTMSRGADDFMNVGSLVTPATISGTTLVPGVLVTPTDTKYMKQDATVKATVRMSERLSVTFGYLFEKYDVSNWQYQNIPYAGGTLANQTNIYLGTNLQNYIAHVGSVVAKYKF